MILSPYRNPSYRSPTPKGNSLSPPPQTSPKRKRMGSEPVTPALKIDTAQQHAMEPDRNLDSPRSKVADRLLHLDIQQPPPQLVIPTREGSDAPRKRLKTQAPHQVPLADPFVPEVSTPEPDHDHQAVFSRSTTPLEIEETPDCRVRAKSLPASPPDRRAAPGGVLDLGSAAGSKKSPRKRSASPPPPEAHSSPLRVKYNNDELLQSSQESMTSDQVSLTWQDDEITGQDIDKTSPDDADGLGINGIGFRPTPAMAYARSQRRKQQINEWRAREAKEARQKRMERRRGGGSESKSDPVDFGRKVRFEDVG